jgi:hypothetical protein
VGLLFTEKREQSAEQEGEKERKKNRCYMCDNCRDDIERAKNDKEGFYQHVHLEHNMWNYIFYLVYLKHKSREEVEEVEEVILEQWRNNRTDWLPAPRA